MFEIKSNVTHSHFTERVLYRIRSYWYRES